MGGNTKLFARWDGHIINNYVGFSHETLGFRIPKITDSFTFAHAVIFYLTDISCLQNILRQGYRFMAVGSFLRQGWTVLHHGGQGVHLGDFGVRSSTGWDEKTAEEIENSWTFPRWDLRCCTTHILLLMGVSMRRRLKKTRIRIQSRNSSFLPSSTT